MSQTEMKQAAVSLFFFYLVYRQRCYRCQGRLFPYEMSVTCCHIFWWTERSDDRGFMRPRRIQPQSGPPWRITTRAVSRRKTTNTRADWYRVVFRDANRLLWITRNAVARNLLTKRLAVTLLARYGGRFRSTKYILNVERGSFDFISYPFDNLSLSDSIIEKI